MLVGGSNGRERPSLRSSDFPVGGRIAAAITVALHARKTLNNSHDNDPPKPQQPINSAEIRNGTKFLPYCLPFWLPCGPFAIATPHIPRDNEIRFELDDRNISGGR